MNESPAGSRIDPNTILEQLPKGKAGIAADCRAELDSPWRFAIAYLNGSSPYSLLKQCGHLPLEAALEIANPNAQPYPPAAQPVRGQNDVIDYRRYADATH